MAAPIQTPVVTDEQLDAALVAIADTDPALAVVLGYLVANVREARAMADQLGEAFANPSMLTRMLGGSLFGG